MLKNYLNKVAIRLINETLTYIYLLNIVNSNKFLR